MPGEYHELVMLPDASRASMASIDVFGGLAGRVLNESDDGRRVSVIEVQRSESILLPSERYASLECVVLNGEVRWNEAPLDTLDYAFLPAAAEPPRVELLPGGRLIVFADRPTSDDGEDVVIVRAAERSWTEGTVALRDTGIELELEIKVLREVPTTGRRTWLLRAGASLRLPWERHSTVEEGFLIQGEYRLVECLPQGRLASVYRPGGYFYRPPGIVHGGPESGSDGEVLWLLRTPQRLDVEFVAGCD